MINKTEQEILQALLRNDHLMKVTKKVFGSTIKHHKPVISPDNDDTVLGQKYRAYMYAKEMLDECFYKLESYRVDSISRENLNKGR